MAVDEDVRRHAGAGISRQEGEKAWNLILIQEYAMAEVNKVWRG